MRAPRSCSRSVSTAVAAICIVICTCPSLAADPEDDSVLRGYFSANGLLNRGMYELAIPEYRSFLSAHGEHPKAAVARYGLALCLFHTQQYDPAADELKRLGKRNKFEYAVEVDMILGQCDLARGRHKTAGEAFARVLKQNGKHELADDAAVLLAESLYRQERFAEVVKPCRTLVSRWPRSTLRPRAEFFWALAEMAGQNYESAAQRFSELLKRDPTGEFVEQATYHVAQ